MRTRARMVHVHHSLSDNDDDDDDEGGAAPPTIHAMPCHCREGNEAFRSYLSSMCVSCAACTRNRPETNWERGRGRARDTRRTKLKCRMPVLPCDLRRRQLIASPGKVFDFISECPADRYVLCYARCAMNLRQFQAIKSICHLPSTGIN